MKNHAGNNIHEFVLFEFTIFWNFSKYFFVGCPLRTFVGNPVPRSHANILLVALQRICGNGGRFGCIKSFFLEEEVTSLDLEHDLPGIK